MSLLSTFCTNSINILAGLNGLEATQALIIAISVALNDLLYLPWRFSLTIGETTHVGGVYDAGMAHGSRELMERHLLSLYFMLPLIGVCIGFLYHNWCVCVRLYDMTYPAHTTHVQVPSPRLPW